MRVPRLAYLRVILFFLIVTSLVLEPNFYLADVDRFFARDFIQARWELFLRSRWLSRLAHEAGVSAK